MHAAAMVRFHSFLWPKTYAFNWGSFAHVIHIHQENCHSIPYPVLQNIMSRTANSSDELRTTPPIFPPTKGNNGDASGLIFSILSLRDCYVLLPPFQEARQVCPASQHLSLKGQIASISGFAGRLCGSHSTLLL